MTTENPYTVLRTDRASEHLNEILWYVHDASGSSQAAIALLDCFEKAMAQLSAFPKMGPVARASNLARRGYRKLTIGAYLILYKVDDEKQQVIVHGVFHQCSDYEHLV